MENLKQFKEKEAQGLIGVIKYSAIYTLVFFAISLSLLFLFSFIFVRLDDPTAWIGIIGKFSLYAPSVLCGFLLARKNSQSHLLCGLLLGALITGIIFVISLLYEGSTDNSVVWLILLPMSTILGSLLCKVRKPTSHKRKRRRKMKNLH